MARGNIAKTEVQRIISEAFGDNYIGEIDKKIYVLANDGGEQVQIAISLTCPKVSVEMPNTKPPARMIDLGGDLDFEAMSEMAKAVENNAPPKISKEEEQNIAEMLARLGL